MKIRELLQVGLSNKRTLGKALAWFGIAVGAFILWSSLWSLESSLWGRLSSSWLTPGERRAATAVLAQLDALQDPSSLSNKEFSARARQLEQGMSRAFRAAWTIRDTVVLSKLSDYQVRILAKRMQMRAPELSQHWKTTPSYSDRQLDALANSSGINSDHLELHKLLD